MSNLTAKTAPANGHNNTLPDVHIRKPSVLGIPLTRVGVEGVNFPLKMLRKNGGSREVHATFAMFCDLEDHMKGTNLSRFVEELSENWANKSLSGKTFPKLLQSLKERLGSRDVYVAAAFDYFISRPSPVTKKDGIMSIPCRFIGHQVNGTYSFIIEVNVPVATYCPCSREMTLTDVKKGVGKGAHAQRGIVTAQIKTDQRGIVWIEDLVESVTRSGSAPVYPVLKRPDEKFATILGYDNPKFTEDVTREALQEMMKIPSVTWTRIRTKNGESIHPHDATSIGEMIKTEGHWGPFHHGFY